MKARLFELLNLLKWDSLHTVEEAIENFKFFDVDIPITTQKLLQIETDHFFAFAQLLNDVIMKQDWNRDPFQ
jgi:hypothetical protein